MFSSVLSSVHTTSARSLRLCLETGDVVSVYVLSTNTPTSGGDDDARCGRRLVSSFCLLVIDVFLQQETLSRAVCRLLKFLGGGVRVFRVRISYWSTCRVCLLLIHMIPNRVAVGVNA